MVPNRQAVTSAPDSSTRKVSVVSLKAPKKETEALVAQTIMTTLKNLEPEVRNDVNFLLVLIFESIILSWLMK